MKNYYFIEGLTYFSKCQQMEIKCNSSLIYFEEELSCYHRYSQITEHTTVYIAQLKICLGIYEGPKINKYMIDMYIIFKLMSAIYMTYEFLMSKTLIFSVSFGRVYKQKGYQKFKKNILPIFPFIYCFFPHTCLSLALLKYL